MPLFSIITVCFNAADLISETMKSVYKQTYDDYEYIIIDGLSTDNTIQVVNDIKDFFDTKGITIVISEKDHGIYDAMNKGAKIATGRYCCFMNAGDTFASPDVLAQLGKQIEDHNYTFVYGDVYSVSKTFKKHVKAQSMDVITNTLSMPYCHQALFASRDFIMEHPFEFKYKNAADYNQCVQLFKTNVEYLQVDVVIANYQIGGKSETGALNYFKEKCEIRRLNNFLKPSKFENDIVLLKMRIRILIKRILPSSMTEKIRKVRA